MLLEVVLSLEGLAANLAGPRHVVFMGALVDHQVVRFREPPLAKLADELAFRSVHFPAELPPVLRLNLHDREHRGAEAGHELKDVKSAADLENHQNHHYILLDDGPDQEKDLEQFPTDLHKPGGGHRAYF